MEGLKRRELLLNMLRESQEPLSGSKLAKRLSVSRQVIVQDIALLRAGGYNIVSTTRGYLIEEDKALYERIFYVKHDTSQIEDELCTIVDYGGSVLDVGVSHPIYGQIATGLVITNRSEVYEFVKEVDSKKTKPLKELTNGEHCHKVVASSEEALDKIEQALKEKNYLIQN